ncbi:hypothetical protein DICPUDRAFT_149879 [Dictyostelium purpureum]|uniref:Uncharacterized protein n=1 Tax=Dictyostelium purpureum TaxID=5786 RepID=F0ZEW1_DICPU|nr:uncharacterized protein DICPUDRAFT_149879 [Dictyostelium purpureum]EGC37496.1 hypothetical protein DICPUDRAFT_149879 [Dictyostelium purpureum]|eukprot:XP_003285970.1 hypothetical protein DICPUDRAFT_149879 [Dictyostelium purpureum]
MTTIGELFPGLRENSSSETNRRLYAVLVAVTDLIRFNKAPINATSYFAIILKTLSENQYKKSQIHDLVKLFSIILPRVSNPVIKNHSVNVILQMTALLEHYVSNDTALHANIASEEQQLIKSAVYCLGYVLVLAESNQWQTKEYLRGYSFILKLAVNNTQSKIRQKSAEQVILVLNSIGAIQKGGSIHKQLATVTSQFCHEVFNGLTLETMGIAFYTLNIVTEALCLLSPSLISLLLEDMIKLTSLSNSALTVACYKAIGSLFFKTNPLIGSQIQQLIDVLFQHPPTGLDYRSMVTYTELLTQSYLYFTKIDQKLCNQHVHNYFIVLMNNFGSDKSEITNTTMEGFKTIIFECVNKDVIEQGIHSYQQKLNGSKSAIKSSLESIVETIESGLRLTFKSSWDLVLLIIQALYEQLGPYSSIILNNLLVGLDNLYHSPEFHHQSHLTQVLITVLGSIGPKNFLNILPLNLDSPPKNKEKINRNWLLPLMRDNIKYTQLSFFIEYFYPMALAMKDRSKQAETEGKYVEARNLEILYSQVWDLLPGFLNHPLDGDQSFKVIARNIGVALSDELGLRTVICVALTQFINKLKESQQTKVSPYIPYRKTHHTMSPERATQILNSVSVFSKNYLPILFNIFPTSNQDQRYFVLNAIEAFVSITDSVTLNSIFNSLITKLVEALTVEGIEKKPLSKDAMSEDSGKASKKEKTKKYYLTDLTIGFVKHLDENNLKVLYKIIKPQLKCSDSGLQKRSFKILVKICEHHESFILQNLNKIKALLVSNLMQSTSNVKKARLKCLREIILSLSKASNKKDLNDDQDDQDFDGEQDDKSNENKPVKLKAGWTHLKTKFIPSLIPEIILCTKETNIKCREISNELLIEIGNIMCIISVKLTPPKRGVSMEDHIANAHSQAIQEYLQLMIAGLASITPHMVSASIVSIARVIHHFYKDLNDEFVGQIVTTSLVLLASPNREIVKAVFGLVRVVIASFKDAKVIESNLEVLINGLAKWGGIDKNYFRVIIQILLERLIKRFGYDQIYPLVPEDFKKVITNIRKKNEKKEKLREQLKDLQQQTQDASSDTKSQKGKSVKGANDDDEQMLASDEDMADSDRDHSEDDADIEDFLFNTKKKKKNDQSDNFLIKEGEDPIDFFDRNAFSHLSAKAAANAVAEKLFAQAAKNGGKIKNPFSLDEDGRMIIEASDEEGEDGKRKRKKSFLDQVFEEQEEAYERKAGYHATKNKSLRKQFNNNNDDDDDSDDEDLERYNDDLKSNFSKRTSKTTKTTRTTGARSVALTNKTVGGKKINDARIETATLRYNRVRGVDHLVNYQDKESKTMVRTNVSKTKGQGDNRKNNQKYEPFSYIKLDPRALNKRRGSKPSSIASLVSKKKK